LDRLAEIEAERLKKIAEEKDAQRKEKLAAERAEEKKL